MNDRKRRRGRAHRTLESGDAASGAAFDPASLEEDTALEGDQGTPRAAPAPQSPLSDDEIERRKSRAVTSRLPPTDHGHPDPAATKKGG